MSSKPNPTPQPNDDEIPVPAPAKSFAENPPLAPNIEDQIREFWDRNSRTIYTVLIVVLVGILAKGGYDYFLEVREAGIAREYNTAATSDQLRRFAGEHGDHALGGVANLRLADEAYSNSKYADAVALYDKAATALRDGPLGGRARLGAGVARLLAGQGAEGERALAALSTDATQLKTVRAEAAYHLGSHLIATGKKDEGIKALDQAAGIDATSTWAERALARKDAAAAL